MDDTNNRNNIRVVCRFRPQNSREIREGGIPIISYDDNCNTCRMEGKDFQGNFTFDRIFPPETPQQFFFDESIKPIVDDVIGGYNETVFAYGQTGSGKTHTMMGDMDNEEFKGLIPRIVEQTFQSIISSPPTMEYTIKVSYVEIYMEKIRDLLNSQNDNLPIHEENNRGVYVKDLLEVYVSSIQEVYEVMKRGDNSRIVAHSNDVNAESLQSHSIFVITVNQKNINDGRVKSGRLSLVDLAGSEKFCKTGDSDQTLEAAALGMAINALTVGKPTHIPYHDSKLTRILQESLGVNSRTTLIINCSPSSFNEAETLNTLGFGMRAKRIKNKARVNAEHSPTELKVLLNKTKNETFSIQKYIAALEDEVSVWRAGSTVPKDEWGFMHKSTSVPVVEEEDEQGEFLKRENELTDRIADKELTLSSREKLLSEMKEELAIYKSQEVTNAQENKQMESELNELKVQLEKVTYENRESVKANLELSAEIETLKKEISDLKHSQKEGNKEQKKKEKMAAMLVELDDSKKVQQIQDTLLKLETINSTTFTIEELSTLRHELSDSKNLVLHCEQTINELRNENEQLRDELEVRLTTLELEHEEFLDKNIAKKEAKNIDITEKIAELRGKLEEQFVAKKEVQQKEIYELKHELEKKNKELHMLNSDLADLKSKLRESKSEVQKNVEREEDMERIRKTMAQQLADFDVMKKALMRDLKDRCEKVVELEVSLDETREQYNNVLRNSNNMAQQKKMAFLDKNLEHLTNVQKQLVEQNSSIKKELVSAEQKLLARNERIQALEALLQDAQEKLTTQNQKFEVQLEAVRERLEQARSQKSQNLNFGRIANPFRSGVPDHKNNETSEETSDHFNKA